MGVLATNPGNLSGISGTHRMEGDKKTVESCPLTSTYAVTCAHLHACTYSQMNKYNKHSCRKISRLDMSYSVVKCRFPSLLSHFLVLCHLKSQQKSLSKPRLPSSLTTPFSNSSLFGSDDWWPPQPRMPGVEPGNPHLPLALPPAACPGGLPAPA